MLSVILYSSFSIRVDNTSIFCMRQAEYVVHQEGVKNSPGWSEGALMRSAVISC
ncbi:MAG: hypothetical protein QOJ04_2672 [Caballeronia sp.]|jgi:hypothetical protein|nr:hypothetical protein [Caballeronia sp.]MEA3112414.1 hypothetical protein [Caballeronia sp.]